MQPVPVPDLLDQLEFLVTKILGGDSLSRFPLIKDKETLSPHMFRFSETYMRVEYSLRRRTCTTNLILNDKIKKKLIRKRGKNSKQPS